MKKIILVVLFGLFASTCFAETFIIYSNSTKEVYTISNQDDAVMPAAGYTKTTIKDELRDLDLQYPDNCYKWNGSRLTINSKKLDEVAVKEEKARKKAENDKLIQDEIKRLAIESLKARNITVEE